MLRSAFARLLPRNSPGSLRGSRYVFDKLRMKTMLRYGGHRR
jgi:hypothetical protein